MPKRLIVIAAAIVLLVGAAAAIAFSTGGSESMARHKPTFGRMPATGLHPVSAVPDFVAVFDRDMRVVGYVKKAQLVEGVRRCVAQSPHPPPIPPTCKVVETIYAGDGKTVIGQADEHGVVVNGRIVPTGSKSLGYAR